MHRTQILLEPDQHKAISEIARHEKRSLSDLFREMVEALIQTRKTQEMEKAAEALLQDYRTDKELTTFTSLDNEDIYAQG